MVLGPTDRSFVCTRLAAARATAPQDACIHSYLLEYPEIRQNSPVKSGVDDYLNSVENHRQDCSRSLEW